jgi:transcriptional regulator with XRE-family HTH domain
MNLLSKLRRALSDRICDLRQKKHWRQADLAAASGLSEGAIQGYEQMKRWPQPEDIEKLAGALGVDPVYLLSGDKDKPMTVENAQDALKCLQKYIDLLPAPDSQNPLLARLSSLDQQQARALNSYLDTLLDPANSPTLVDLDTKQVKKRG